MTGGLRPLRAVAGVASMGISRHVNGVTDERELLDRVQQLTRRPLLLRDPIGCIANTARTFFEPDEWVHALEGQQLLSPTGAAARPRSDLLKRHSEAVSRAN